MKWMCLRRPLRWTMPLVLMIAVSTLAAQEATFQQWVTDLASERMEGRGAGTKGIQIARDRLVEQFESFGLRPAFGDSYTQPFTVRFGAKASVRKLAIRGDHGKSDPPPAAGKDYSVLGFSAGGTFAAPTVFVGYGCKSPSHKYDSYATAGDAVKGKVVIAFRYEPMDANGKSRWGAASTTYGGWSHAAFLNNKARWAAEAGAVALLLVNPPSQDRNKTLRSTAGSAFGGRAKIPVYHITSALLRRLLGKSEAAVRELEAKANATAQPPMTPAKLPGAGKLAEQIVIIGAHYDHLGYGGRGSRGGRDGRGKIHPGADDNASGTAGVVMLAKWFSKRTPPAEKPRRTIIFTTFSAEEIGLIGSRYMANHLSEMGISANRVVAMLNLDMIGRLRNGRIGVYGIGTSKQWPKLVKTAARGLALKPRLGASAFGGSDHRSFVRKKIPVLFFNTGGHRDYHTPRDTADKINAKGAVEVCRLIERILASLQTDPVRLTFDAKAATQASRRTHRGPRSRARLGILPDLSRVKGGCGIAEVLPDGPADKGGLKADDVIVKFDGKPITNLRDLLVAMAACKPERKVLIEIRRKGKPLELTVTLGKR